MGSYRTAVIGFSVLVGFGCALLPLYGWTRNRADNFVPPINPKSAGAIEAVSILGEVHSAEDFLSVSEMVDRLREQEVDWVPESGHITIATADHVVIYDRSSRSLEVRNQAGTIVHTGRLQLNLSGKMVALTGTIDQFSDVTVTLFAGRTGQPDSVGVAVEGLGEDRVYVVTAKHQCCNIDYDWASIKEEVIAVETSESLSCLCSEFPVMRSLTSAIECSLWACLAGGACYQGSSGICFWSW